MTDLMIPTMTRTYGRQPTTMPRGYFKAVQFPVLAMLDKTTGDHRRLNSTGADVRALPLSIKFATKTDFGHTGAEVSGALFESTIDPGTGIWSGLGFLLDDENGHRHARLIATQAMRGNSVDLAEIKALYIEDLDSEDWWIEFVQYKLAATTGVATPAFAEAHATVDELTDEEMTAAMGPDPMVPLVVQIPDELYASIIGAPEEDIVASGSQVVPFDAFYVPEADKPTKIVVDAVGQVYGHLALWESCHDGFADRCLRVPRPTDAYASFNKAGPLTERGQVETGPIFALGGHRSSKSAPTIEQAYGGIENTWCDVRVVEGKFGPWLSGLVRPGVSDEVIYAARASRISGHWVQSRLKAIVSVNAEGYDVPGDPQELVASFAAAGFAFVTDDDGVAELFASFPECAEEDHEVVVTTTNQLTFHFSTDAELIAFTERIVRNAKPDELLPLATVEVVEVVEPQQSDSELLAQILEDDRDAEE